jgi:hypothetical protein
VSAICATATVRPPLQLDDDGLIIDADGQPVAYLAARLNDGGDTGRVIGRKLAAALDLETALADLVDDMREVLSLPLMQEAGITPRGPALERALAVLAQARQP